MQKIRSSIPFPAIDSQQQLPQTETSLLPPTLDNSSHHLTAMEDYHYASGSPIQRKELLQGGFGAHNAAPDGIQKDSGLPDSLKQGVESLSGMSMDGVRVHYNSSQPAQLNALAYAQGRDIHLGPGQERHLPHEAWHVVQQAEGRVAPTTPMKKKTGAEAMGVNDNEALEREADLMGAKAAQQQTVRHEAMNSVSVSATLPTHEAGAPVQRVKIDMSTTTGTEYDKKKHAARKAIERKRFTGLPGPIAGAEDFTWHHVVPQSHIDLPTAENPLLMRLGPSTSYRIDDPGNEYTDPNYRADGTLTPFSEAVEGSLNKAPKLDHAILAQKLNELLAGDRFDAKNKVYADPGQWHIALARLSEASGLTGKEIAVLRGLAKPSTYSVKGKQQKEDAVSWLDLKKDKLDILSAGLFDKLDAHIKKNPKIFFRGYQEKNEIDIRSFRITRHLRSSAESELTPTLDADPTLRAEILSMGKVLVFVKESHKLGDKVNKALAELISAQGLGSWQGVNHKYYLGDGSARVDVEALTRSNRTRQEMSSAGIGEKSLVLHTITGSDEAAEMQMGRFSASMTEEEIPIEGLSHLLGLGRLAEGKSKGGPKSRFIVLDSEEESFVVSGKMATKIDSKMRKNQNYARQAATQATISERGKDVDKFNKPIYDREIRALREKKLNEYKLTLFRSAQEKRIDAVNASTARHAGYVGGSGSDEAQKEAESLSNADFLKKYWSSGLDSSTSEFRKTLDTIPLQQPTLSKGKEPDFAEPVELFTKATHTLLHNTVIGIREQVRRLIADTLANIDKTNVAQKPALAKPTVAPVERLVKSVHTATDKDTDTDTEHIPVIKAPIAEPPVLGQARALLVDADGGIQPEAQPLFVAAYRHDMRTRNTYLTEGEGHAIASRLGIALSVFRSAGPATIPVGWERIENDGGGNCLIHSIYQASRDGAELAGSTPDAASPEEIGQARAVLMPDEDIVALCAAAIAAELEGGGEQGLGPMTRALIWRACADKYIAPAIRGRKPSGDTSGAGKKKEPPAIPGDGAVVMPQIGTGAVQQRVAILHTGGNHWVMLRKIATADDTF